MSTNQPPLPDGIEELALLMDLRVDWQVNMNCWAVWAPHSFVGDSGLPPHRLFQRNAHQDSLRDALYQVSLDVRRLRKARELIDVAVSKVKNGG